MSERCAEWRGALALERMGRLDEDERVAVQAHLDGCAACREMARELTWTVARLEDADPERLSDVHEVPSTLRSVVSANLAKEVMAQRRGQRGRRIAVSVGSVVLAVAAGIATLFLLTGRPSGMLVQLHGRPGVVATAMVEPEAWGSKVDIQESGMRGGQVLQVWVGDTYGDWVRAGSFRTIAGRTVRVRMACSASWRGRTLVKVVDTSGHAVLSGAGGGTD